jgi:putative ABC transport system permease protein
LIVGVTLVAAVSSGAASVQKTLNQIVDQQTPIDLTVSVPYQPSSGEDAPTAGLPAGLASAITDAPGVKAVATPPTAYLQGAAGACADGACPADAWQPLQTTGIDPALAAQILHGDTVAGPLAAGEAVMSFSAASRSGAQDGGQLTLSGDRGSWTSTVRVTQSWGWDVLLPLDGFTALTSSQTATGAWVAISPDADPIAVFNRVEQIASANPDANGNPPWVDGQAKQRAAFTQVITTLLIIVTALFGVAVIIAFVGVANTLSLSVIERRRESALLRALGLTRGQMRGMLALEGVVIAAVGSLLGLVLGVALGWAGAYLLLSLINSAALAVSPLQIGVMLAIAIVAGLIASVLPGRSAANAQPALALASE